MNKDKNDFSNHDALELLLQILEKKNLAVSSACLFANGLKHHAFYLYQLVRLKRRSPTALIISSDTVEQNILSQLLSHQNFQVFQVRTKEELFNRFPKKRYYDAIIISDQFKEIGLNFFQYYFYSPIAKHRACMIHLGDDEVNLNALGFQASLSREFLSEAFETALQQ